MKFGKQLLKAVEVSDPEWGPYWMNYKFLKKKAKTAHEEVQVKAELDTAVGKKRIADPQALSKSKSEVAFFTLLRKEVEKTTQFYNETLAMFSTRRAHIREGVRQLNDAGLILDGYSHNRVRNSCLRFYRDLILLENFAIMNYCGFSKILKKHDKLTGYETRCSFMKNIVHKQPFTHYKDVLVMIDEAHGLIDELSEKHESKEKEPPKEEGSVKEERNIKEDQTIFLDFVKIVKEKASRIRKEEQSELEGIDKEISRIKHSVDSDSSSDGAISSTTRSDLAAIKRSRRCIDDETLSAPPKVKVARIT